MAGFGELLGRAIREAREARGWTQGQLAERAFADPDKVRRIVELETGKVRLRPQARNYRPLCQAVGIDAAQIEALKAEASGEAVAAEPDFAISDVEKLRPWMESHAREVLEGLALRFGHDDPETIAVAELKAFLISKAQDLKKLEAQIAGLPDPSGRIANIKAAALAAVEAGDLDEARALVADALAIQRQDRTLSALRDDAELVEIQAQIALAQNDHAEAHRLYLGIAESFRPFDPDEFAQRCFDYMKPLYFDALRYGGDGLKLGADLLRHMLSGDIETRNPELWATAQNNLAIALSSQAFRTAGPQGADLLAEAVGAFHDALRVRTEAEHPVEWAATQNNLALALRDQAARTAGPTGADLLAEAVRACRDALRVYTEADHPVEWAATQNNLAIALRDQGTRTAGPKGADLLAEAVQAYRDALRVYTETDHPVDWAMTQNNLALALSDQGNRTAGPKGADLLAEAVRAYRYALRVYTEADHPLDWAQVQENLARTHEALANHDSTAEPRPHLEEALTHVSAALTIYDPVAISHRHQEAVDLRDRIAARLGRA